MTSVTPRGLRLLLATLLASVLAASVSHAQLYKDERFGYSMRLPRGFNEVPTGSHAYIIGHWVSDKETDYVDEVIDSRFYLHRPDVQVIIFIDESIKSEVEVDEDTNLVQMRAVFPYRDYKQFMEKTYRRGFHFSKEEQGEENGMPVTRYEVKVEKGSSFPLTLMTWEFTTELGRIAVQTEAMTPDFDKFATDFKRMLGSFKQIERTEPLDLKSLGSSFISLANLDEMEPEERADLLREYERVTWQNAVSDLPDGWETMEIDGVRCMTRADKSYTKKAVNHVLATFRFMDETFPDIGPDSYVRMPMLRVCKDADEERAFQRSSRQMGHEIITHKSSSGATSFEWGWINRRTMTVWFTDKNRDLWFALPTWLREGLRQTIEEGELKGSKLKFSENMFWKNQAREADRNDALLSIRDLMHMNSQDFGRKVQARDYGPLAQSIFLVDFLMNGSASKKRKTKDLLRNYINHVADVTREIAEEREAAEKGANSELDNKPKTEEEEDEYFKKRQQAIEDRQDRILSEAFIRTFDGWDDRDFAKFEKDYLKTL